MGIQAGGRRAHHRGAAFDKSGAGADAWLRMLFTVLVGAVPLVALPITNLLYILMASLGGIFHRPELMPGFLDRISLMITVRHICELIWAAALGLP